MIKSLFSKGSFVFTQIVHCFISPKDNTSTNKDITNTGSEENKQLNENQIRRAQRKEQKLLWRKSKGKYLFNFIRSDDQLLRFQYKINYNNFKNYYKSAQKIQYKVR